MDRQQPSDDRPDAPAEFKPGDTIAPSAVTPDLADATPEPAASVTPVLVPAPPAPASAITSVPAQYQAVVPPVVPAPTEVPPVAETADIAPTALPQASAEISWTASEFVAHDKSASWYAVLAVVVAVLAFGVFLLTKDKISTAVVLVAGVALGIYGARKPRQLQYALNEQGLTIGDKHYSYDQFRSFVVIDEGAFSSIAFTPLRRFGQLTTIYYDPKDEDAIIALLADRLPMEEKGRDAVDSFMKRIRF